MIATMGSNQTQFKQNFEQLHEKTDVMKQRQNKLIEIQTS